MANATRQLESQILSLPPRQRARLAARIISSLDDQTDSDVERLWAEEAEARLEEIRSGKVRSRAGESVFRRARTALR